MLRFRRNLVDKRALKKLLSFSVEMTRQTLTPRTTNTSLRNPSHVHFPEFAPSILRRRNCFFFFPPFPPNDGAIFEQLSPRYNVSVGLRVPKCGLGLLNVKFGSISDILGQEGVAYVRFIDFHLSVGRKKELVGLFFKTKPSSSSSDVW